MGALTKKQKNVVKQFDFKNVYGLEEAIEVVKKSDFVKFNSSVDVAISLNIDPKKTDQVVKGSLVLPNGIGKTPSVVVICGPDKEEQARNAGADFVGNEDIIEKIKAGWTSFNVMVTEPSLMAKVASQIGRIIGPKGLMPSPANNTVTTDIATAVKEVKSGRISFRVEKQGIIHTSIGKVSFTTNQLKENFMELVALLVRLKPGSAKTPYLKKVSISSTMGKGVKVLVSSIVK